MEFTNILGPESLMLQIMKNVKQGNALEVEESILTLKDEGPEDLREITLALSAYMLVLGKKALNYKDARSKLEKLLSSGAALEKFREFIIKQGGNPMVIEKPEIMGKANIILEVKAETSGYIHQINTLDIGLASVSLGAGREKVSDEIDITVGFHIYKKLADRVETGEVIAKVYCNDKAKGEIAIRKLLDAYTIKDKKIEPPSLIYKFVTADNIESWDY